MKFDFDLAREKLELSSDQDGVLWIPAIPATTLNAYKGRRVKITTEYLELAASETRRFYSDLAEQKKDFKRPILCAHDDNGRRSGSLLDFAVREYKGIKTLFVKAKFLAESYAAVLSGKLANGSISILPEWTDSESGKNYAPFISEWSETHSPIIKGFSVSELLETPRQLVALNLTLSEDKMENEEIQNLIAQIESAIDEKLAPVFARLDALDGGEGEEETEETEAEPEAVEASDAPEETPEAVEASEADPVLVALSEISDRLGALEEKTARTERVAAKGVQISKPGTPIAASEKKKVTLSQKQRLEKIKKEQNLHGIDAVIALREQDNV